MLNVRRFWIATALAVTPAGTGAQAVVQIPADAEPYCGCELVLEPVVTLGEFDGPGTLARAVKRMRQDANGVFFALSWQQDEVYRFHRDGTPLPSVGRTGEGPGEALRIKDFDLVGDSIVVFDSGNKRITVFTPDLAVARTSSSLGGFMRSAAHVPGHGFVVSANYSGAERWGIPLHFHSMRGDFVRSFGGSGIVRVDAPFLWRRRVAAGDGAVWAAYENQLTFERWTVSGGKTHVIERETDWFAPYLVVSWGGPDQPRSPKVLDIVTDSRGMLRTLVGRASPHWAERLPDPRPNVAGDMIYPIPEGIGLFESVIEIIDPDTGQLYASSVVPQELYGFVDPEHVFSYSEEPDRVPRVTVWRVRLASAPPSHPSGGSE